MPHNKLGDISHQSKINRIFKHFKEENSIFLNIFLQIFQIAKKHIPLSHSLAKIAKIVSNLYYLPNVKISASHFSKAVRRRSSPLFVLTTVFKL